MNYEAQLKSAIADGSKSFYWASLFLPRKVRRQAWLLYYWCRLCDDAIDQATHLEQAKHQLQIIRSQLDQVFIGLDKPSDLSPDQKDLASSYPALPNNPFHWWCLQELAPLYPAAQSYPFYDMCRGFAYDLDQPWLLTMEQFLDYCYCVAGTVGLMMLPILRVQDPRAYTCAKALGTAMQMTNMLRDLETDYNLKRVYLPLTWVQQPNRLHQSLQKRHELFTEVASPLFQLTEDYYRQGLAGLKYIPLHSRWAIAIAAFTYRQIGVKVIQLKSKAWEQRVHTHGLEKWTCAFRALWACLPLSHFR